jgi:hypothetical protein
MFTLLAQRVNWAARVSVLYRLASLRLKYGQQSKPHEPAHGLVQFVSGLVSPSTYERATTPEPEYEHEHE